MSLSTRLRVGVEERIARAKELTEGVGPDLVIESAGEPDVFIEALRMVRKGGTVIEVGNWVDLQRDVQLDVMRHISSKNLHIHSVFHCGNQLAPSAQDSCSSKPIATISPR